LFLNVLLVSRLKFFRLSPLIWFGFCNHCNLVHFQWSINFEHSSSKYAVLCFILCYPRLSLAEVFIFSRILSYFPKNYYYPNSHLSSLKPQIYKRFPPATFP
jgi:hypothetical protein